ncbi:MAG: NADH-quinone oxidoreductase subunit J [Phycisphaeraceae bacterium]|nr:NADH-quinone oxidoreductase subunit J [Phycisphaeraceae bacterium]
MDHLIHPIALYLGLALVGLGLCVALPRARVSPQVIGALLAAGGLGVILVLMGLKAKGELPNLYFYVFSLVALGGSLRVVTHPRPVYSAIYFILTILASCGLYLLLSAEFMAFALVIVYAGAILITYLFVIMLATQAPTEDRTEGLKSYDIAAREPMLATVASMALVAVLTGMLFTGVSGLEPRRAGASHDALLAQLPRRVEDAMKDASAITFKDRIVERDGAFQIDIENRRALVTGPDGERWVDFPAKLAPRNVEALGFNLLNTHPGSIEIAGVILLMAMLGAVVLSRRQVEIDEEAKVRQARNLMDGRGAEGQA